MQTEHVVHVADARAAVAALPDDAVDLVVTSPPYPMVEMWDESFAAQDPAIAEALAAGAGSRAFELMHDLLDGVWAGLPRVVRPGGIVVVNVVHVADAREAVAALPDDAVDLVVTSPPYPMVEMWDESFAAQDPAIAEALAAGAGSRAFELMHDLLDGVWAELPRVVRPGGIVVVNVGPATRTLAEFQQYPNHEAITRRLRDHGFQSLPGVLWRKPTNSAAKFMGSGMLPTNAYPTLEHEHLLVFRNGGTRSFPPGDDRRYESAYFWEERNEWFSDLWEFAGERQALDGDAAEARDRSGAFPLDLPLRLVRMFSVYGDTVLDPFWGTGTTSLAALVSGRSSVGIERDPDLVGAFDERVADAPELSATLARERLDRHREFVAERRADGDEPGYDAEHYDFPVVTKQERRLRLYETTTVRREPGADADRRYVAEHEPV